MNSGFVATAYERVWRPLAFYAASGVTTRAEQLRARRDLYAIGPKKLLDVACGPGNFTRHLSVELSRVAKAIGLRMFDRDTFVDQFRNAGLVDVGQEAQRALQYVTATKPPNIAR